MPPIITQPHTLPIKELCS